MPTRASSDSARTAASFFDRCIWMRILSIIWLPIVNTGFRDVNGS